METQSFWEATTPTRPEFPALEANLEVDVAIIGGGITGITTALQLTNAGQRVAILEARRVGGGTTGWSTGNLYVPVGAYFHNISKARDEESMKTVAHSRNTALDFIELQTEEKNIDCHFARRPWYFFTQEKDMVKTVEKEVEALQKAGFRASFLDSVPHLKLTEVQRAAQLDGQARFHPLRYVLGLAEAVAKNGCQIYEHTTVIDYKEEDDYCTVTTNRGTVKCKQIVIATHIPIGIHSVQTVASPYRSYVVAMRLKNNDYPNAYFWHNDKTHHAITTHSSTNSMELDMLMIAGNHHKTGQASHQEYQQYFNQLEEYARQHFDVASVEYRWSAQHYRSGDGIPYIGLSHKGAKRTYLATGYYADGLIYGTVAGIQISDMILNRQNSWTEAFDATRGTNLATAASFVKENVNVAAQYLKDVPVGQVSHFKDIQPGEGKTIEIDSEKLAVYRDEHNKLHVCSAVCTHMKCIVNWNNAERTWDCPCHGSRFMIDGSVIEGPAIANLAPKKVDEQEEKLLD